MLIGGINHENMDFLAAIFPLKVHQKPPPCAPGHRQVGEGHQQRRGGGRLFGAAFLALGPAKGCPRDVLRVDLGNGMVNGWVMWMVNNRLTMVNRWLIYRLYI